MIIIIINSVYTVNINSCIFCIFFFSLSVCYRSAVKNDLYNYLFINSEVTVQYKTILQNKQSTNIHLINSFENVRLFGTKILALEYGILCFYL